MIKSLIYVGAGVLAIGSSLGIKENLNQSSYETRQNAPQVNRVFELEEELFKLTGGLKGREALERYVNDSQFRDSYTSLTSEYNSLIEQPNIHEARSTINRANTLAELNGLLAGAGLVLTVLGLCGYGRER